MLSSLQLSPRSRRLSSKKIQGLNPHQRIPEDSSRVEKALPEGICQCSDDLVCAMKKAPEYKVNSISVPDPAHQKGKQ